MVNKEKKAPITVGILNIDRIRQIVLPTLLALYKLKATHIQNIPRRKSDILRYLLPEKERAPQIITPKAASTIPAKRTDLGGSSVCIITPYVINW